MRYAKPATTFDEQADLLLKRGMIGERTMLIARLSFVNYYRLSAEEGVHRGRPHAARAIRQ